MIRIKSDRIILKDRIFDGFIYLDNEIITEISKNAVSCEKEFDFTGKYVSAGFIDIHTHGGAGFAFADSSLSHVVSGCNFHLTHGTTTIVPTISASPFDQMEKSLDNVKNAMESGECIPHVLGAHLEGPYLSKEQCGAQCPSFITPPIKEQYEDLVKRYKSSICRWTYAPENDPNGDFCRFLTQNGIIASAGHTNARLPHMEKAIDCGCRLVTHLYSCTSSVTREMGFRHLGVIEATYLKDELFAEIIADSKHLPPELIKLIVKIKGFSKVIAVTDSLEVAGSGITRGRMCGTDFIVEDGVAKLPDRSAFAGSIATADVLLRTLVFDCGFDIVNAVSMLTLNPATLFGLDSGEIARGKQADLVVFDDDVSVSHVFVSGSLVYSA